jgi:hypothetical protein
MIFKNKNIILIYFIIKITLKNNHYLIFKQNHNNIKVGDAYQPPTDSNFFLNIILSLF